MRHITSPDRTQLHANESTAIDGMTSAAADQPYLRAGPPSFIRQ